MWEQQEVMQKQEVMQVQEQKVMQVHKMGHEHQETVQVQEQQMQEVVWVQEQHEGVQEQGVVWMREQEQVQCSSRCRCGACPSLLNCLIAQVDSGVHLSLSSPQLLRAAIARAGGRCGCHGKGPWCRSGVLPSGGGCLGNTIPSAGAWGEPRAGLQVETLRTSAFFPPLLTWLIAPTRDLALERCKRAGQSARCRQPSSHLVA